MTTLRQWALAPLLAISSLVLAQTYPARPITIVVPFAAGGPVDADTRRYAALLHQMTGQPVVIDNKPGAGTAIGTAYVAKAKPDGYTLLSNSSAFAVFPAFYTDLKFDPLKDLAPVTLMHVLLSVLMTPPVSPIRNFTEYLTYTRANPGKLSYGTSGVGDVSHLSGVWMHAIANSKVTFVPYKGNGPMMIDLLAGRIDVGSASLVQALPHIRAGRLRALAVRGPTRVKPLPDVPAVNEHAGMQAFSHENWQGVFAPAGLSSPVMARLHGLLTTILKQPEIMAELESQASKPVGNSPAEFRAIISEEIGLWKKVVAETGIAP